MFVAGNDDIIASYVDISGAGGSTQEENGVESQLKLGAGADEGTSHWLHLYRRVGRGRRRRRKVLV